MRRNRHIGARKTLMPARVNLSTAVAGLLREQHFRLPPAAPQRFVKPQHLVVRAAVRGRLDDD